ncbi:site-specific DNA-methyltransferase, partial [bacterium]|nr:site-specific DNA-methyltransferase [bacterium]
LLQQATRPGDIVLDFFAGSGTTGHAVLELNAEDNGQRRFILCSSTEATHKEPEKNLCRDVCAERLRRVMRGYGGKAAYSPEQGDSFAYLQLDLIEAADVNFEATEEHAFQMLGLRLYASVQKAVEVAPGVRRVSQSGDCAHLLLPEVNANVLAELESWLPTSGAARLAIWSPRPDSLAAALAARGIEANCYGLLDALLRGQSNR